MKKIIKESTGSVYLDFDELTDFPYDGEDYNGDPVKILRKGTSDSLGCTNPEAYGIDDGLADECVEVERNGHKVVFAYDESGVVVYRKHGEDTTKTEKKITYRQAVDIMEEENFLDFLIEERSSNSGDIPYIKKSKKELEVCAAVVYAAYLSGSVIKEDFSNLSIFHSGYIGIEIKVNNKVSVLVYCSPGVVGREDQKQPEFFIRCNALGIADSVYKCSDRGKPFGNVSMYEADVENEYGKMLTLLESILNPFNSKSSGSLNEMKKHPRPLSELSSRF
jgi:hypothetical protein